MKTILFCILITARICVQQSTDAKSTIQAKKAFEAYAWAFGIEDTHYHANNGIFNSQ